MSRTLEDYYETADDGGGGLASLVHPRRLGRGVASLVGHEETDPEPRAYARSSSGLRAARVDIDRPDGDAELYWKEYKNNPIISTPLHNLASETFEAGWWITAESDETVEEMTEYCHNMSIEAGRTHRSLSDLGQLMVIQYHARGTFLGEKVTDERGRHVALNPVNPSTVEMYTKAGVNILVPPDYNPDNSSETIKRTADGEVAAYVQFDRSLGRWDDRAERKFARDQMVHWARRPDIGDLRGNSVIEPIFERSRALREKLQDNDLAIAMKAWPMVIFQTGTPDRPWTESEQNDLLDDYTHEALGPGMYQAVPGDVQVHEFAGETADIGEHVQTDVNMIISAMPGPKFALGSFVGEDGVGTEGAHERQYLKLVRSLRRDLEELLTPYLTEVAESWDLDTTDLELHIGRPGDEVAPEDVQGSIIRYQSNAGDDDDTTGAPGAPGGDNSNDGGGGDTDTGGGSDTVDDNTTDGGGGESAGTVPAVGPVPALDTAELSDPRMVETADIEETLGSLIADILGEARDETLDRLEQFYTDDPPPGRVVRTEFEAYAHRLLNQTTFDDEVDDGVGEVIERTIAVLGNDGHRPQIEAYPSEFGVIESETGNGIDVDVRALVGDIGIELERQTDEIAATGYGVDAVSQRVREVWSDGMLEHRGRLIARMRCQQCLNRAKLSQYQNHDDIEGVELVGNCSEDTHRLTDDIAGCSDGSPAVAYFDTDEPLGAQFQAQTDVDIPTGFDPLPDTPPFRFGDRTEIAPIYTEQ